MKNLKPLSVVALLLTLSGCSVKTGWAKHEPPPSRLPPLPPREFRAAWVATVANIDWPSKSGLSGDQQIAEMRRILDRAVELHLNAIILQVRTTCDAFYASPYEPWSEYLSGTQGVPPSPYYDPLAAWVKEAHDRGLELHAWFNPYRARHPSAKSPDAPAHVANSNPQIVRKFGGYEWLDPGEPQAAKQTLDVILDVVRRYDIDGVHLDDYFYPYKEYLKDQPNTDFPDQASWTKYQQSGGKLSRDDWRRDNVNRLVRDLYAGIKAEKPHVKFGISPFGIAHPNTPETVESKFDQYNTLYADAQLWLKEGWCDYYTPQLYWRLDSKQPFADLLRWWVDQNDQHRHLWPGSTLGHVNTGKDPWPASETLDQIETSRQILDGDTGNVFFSMIAFLQDRGGVNELLTDGPYAETSLVPASPWLDDKPPLAPKIQADVYDDNSVQLTWENWDMEIPRLWAVWVKSGGQWRFSTYGGTVRSIRIIPESGQRVQALNVAAVDRTGNANFAQPIKIHVRKKR
jgi:uncharacterized lipoprotein YddW (UPF0748 family)